MCLFDPVSGNRRRAYIRDKTFHEVRALKHMIDLSLRDLSHSVRGHLAAAGSHLREEALPDTVLAQRVRAKLGRVVSHPGSIDVTANNGQVTLSGPILAREVNALLRAVRSVRGVAGVESRLEVHEQADIPALQGGRPRPGDRPDILQARWAPRTRLLIGLVSSGLVFQALRRRGPLGIAQGAAGAILLGRALSNLPVKRLLGVGGGRRGIIIQKTININAPIDRVFDFWDFYENFPHFMRNVREVRPVAQGRSHWTVAGPAGIPVEWDAEVVKRIPNQELAWRSVEGSVVEHAGRVRFESNPDGSTRVDIHMTYNPPAGAVGHVVASLFGADPKHEMDQDLLRMKTLIETGILPHDAAQPTWREAERAQEGAPI